MRMVHKVSVPRLYAGMSLIWRLAGCMPTWGRDTRDNSEY